MKAYTFYFRTNVWSPRCRYSVYALCDLNSLSDVFSHLGDYISSVHVSYFLCFCFTLAKYTFPDFIRHLQGAISHFTSNYTFSNIQIILWVSPVWFPRSLLIFIPKQSLKGLMAGGHFWSSTSLSLLCHCHKVTEVCLTFVLLFFFAGFNLEFYLKFSSLCTIAETSGMNSEWISVSLLCFFFVCV